MMNNNFEKTLYTVFMNYPEPLIILDTDNNTELSNLAAEKFFIDMCLPIPKAGMCLRDAIPWLANEIEDFAKGDLTQYKIEKALPDLNGKCREFEFTLIKNRDANLNYKGMIIYIEDVTEQNDIESKLRALPYVVEQNPCSIMITDTKGQIVYVNPKFTEITGYTLQEVKGLNPGILSAGFKSAQEYKEIWETISSGKEWHGEFCNRKKNGEIYWEMTSISPVKNKSGKITHYLAVKKDVTRHKRIVAGIKEQNQKLKLQLEMAARVQQKLLPKESLEFSGVTFSWNSTPSIYIAGDMFNIFKISDDLVRFYILDVMGHGVSAALKAITLNYLLKPPRNDTELLPPSKVLQLVNERVINDAEEINIYTVFLGVLDVKKLELTYARAGHCPPMIVTEDGSCRELKEGGPAIGLARNILLEDYKVQLRKGDKVILYTDGIIEAKNTEDMSFGKARLCDLLVKERHLELTDLTKLVIQEVLDHTGTKEVEDDLTILAIGCT